MKKVLVLASVASMIEQFNMPNIELLQSLGYAVEVACNFEKGSTYPDEINAQLREKLDAMDVKYHQIDFSRNILDLKKNLLAMKQVKALFQDNTYCLVHCHSPIGGVVGRLVAGKARRQGTKVIYTAHGFHFYKGAPLFNWLVYYTVERFLARYTDVLITINQEDYSRAKKFRAGRVEHVPGVGVDTAKIVNTVCDEMQVRKSLGVPEKACVVLSVGELSRRKNHKFIINAMAGLRDLDIRYVICGTGPLLEELESLCDQLGVKQNVIFAGFRSDIYKILKIADVFVFPSIQEGLPVALMEAMAGGVPCVVSEIRGNVELIQNGVNGYVCPLSSKDEFERYILLLCNDKPLGQKMGQKSVEFVKNFDSCLVNGRMREIYTSILETD